MLLDVLSALFLTHVVHAANVKTNQRRFAPTLPHIAGITGPLHRNTHHRRTWGEDRVFFYDERGRLSALPAAWTDFVSPDPFVKIAAGRSLFRAEDLVELVEQVRSLHKKDGRHV